jgi:hypothetical protein
LRKVSGIETALLAAFKDPLMDRAKAT